MVFSDDFLHFLKIKKQNCRIHQNYLVALNIVKAWFKKEYIFLSELNDVQIG